MRNKCLLFRHFVLSPLTPGAYCHTFWTFWRFSAWIWSKLAPMYSKVHLPHESMPFFPLALHFTTFLLGQAQEVTTSLGFFCFIAFPLSLVITFCRQWLSFFWACFQFKNFCKRIIETRAVLTRHKVSVIAENFACRSWVYMMPIFVRSGTKAGYGWQRSQWV